MLVVLPLCQAPHTLVLIVSSGVCRVLCVFVRVCSKSNTLEVWVGCRIDVSSEEVHTAYPCGIVIVIVVRTRTRWQLTSTSQPGDFISPSMFKRETRAVQCSWILYNT